MQEEEYFIDIDHVIAYNGRCVFTADIETGAW